jgi:hypothetical protein
VVKNIRIAGILLLLAASLAACSSQVSLVDPKIPSLLIEKMPLAVAVKYPKEFDHYVYQEEVLGDDDWTIDLGSANKGLFNNLFGDMFSSVHVVKDGEDLKTLQFDAYIEPSIEAFEFSIPAQSRTKAYAVWIRYRLKVFDSDGTQISNWPVSAYGKQQAGKFNGATAIKQAAILAMRDATAVIGIQMDKATGISKISDRSNSAVLSEPAIVDIPADAPIATDEDTATSE